MLIEEMPRALKWKDAAAMLTVHRSYTDLLGECFGDRMSLVRNTDKELWLRLTRVITAATNDSLARVITAPEVSWYLIWQPTKRASDAVQFICDAIEREEYRIGSANSCQPGWSPLGDFEVMLDGSVRTPITLANLMPIDVESPYASRADLGSGAEVNILPREAFSASELCVVKTRLVRAERIIRQTSGLVGDFTNHFTKVLVIQKHPIENTFSSGTTGQYIGRSVLANVQQPDVTVSEVVDAIVHEAIHSLLFMQERRRRWVLTDSLYDPTPRAVSPWSGRHLPLRAFLQACFVWYGLLNFWLQAFTQRVEIEGEAGSQCQIQRRIEAATTGFIKGSLCDRISEFKEQISADILSAIQDMQERVTDAFGRSLAVVAQ